MKVGPFVLAVAWVAAAAIAWKYGIEQHWPVVLWAVACALSALGVGFLQLLPPGDRATLTAAERGRFGLLLFGGLVGFFTAFLGFLLPFTEFSGYFAGGLKELRANPRALVWTGLALFGGLTLMFLSLQLARGQERTSPNLRRLLYGFNAVLGAILLVSVLGLLNILPYTGVPPFRLARADYDWTSDRIFSVSEKTQNTLASLQQPVMVYVLMSRGQRATYDMENLLEACKRVSPQLFNWSSLSRDRNRTDFAELVKKYPVPDPDGVYVLYGTEPKVDWDFIKSEDLVTEPTPGFRGAPAGKYVFKGENALMKTIAYLREGKSRAVVYFTQGSGEYELSGHGFGGRSEPGLGVLSEKLGKSNYETKELKLGPGSKVPDDADVVAVIRPGGLGSPLAEDTVKALQDYMTSADRKKKGKLIVLTDAVVRNDGKWVDTGLEGLLGQFGVRLDKERLIDVRERDPGTILVYPAKVNAIVSPFVRQEIIGYSVSPLVVQNVRPVQRLSADPQGGGHTVETLLQTGRVPRSLVVAEPDGKVSLGALVADLRKPENEQKLIDRIKREPVPVAVTVAESKGPPPGMPPGHPPTDKGGGTPRLVVFGSASWVENQTLQSDAGQMNYELFANCLTWLRERPDIGRQADDKERKEYLFTPEADVATRLQILPTTLMLLGVLGLAGGVWVVRRR